MLGFCSFLRLWGHQCPTMRLLADGPGSIVLWGIPHFAWSRPGGTFPLGTPGAQQGTGQAAGVCESHSRAAYRDTSYDGGCHTTPATRAARSTLMRAGVMAAVATHRTTSECDLLRGTAPQCVARHCMARKKHQCHGWRRNWRSYLGHLVHLI